MPKQKLRQSMLARRAALSVAEWHSKSQTIQQSLLALPYFSAAGIVALYAPCRKEVDTELLLQEAVASGKTVCYPQVNGPLLEFRRVGRMKELKPGAFGIMEPTAEAPIVSLESIELFVVPGVAFDRSGRRVGYGKGYYDRTLHKLEATRRFIGLCYEFQVVEELAGEAHDIPVDAIITEQRVIAVSRDYHTGGSH